MPVPKYPSTVRARRKSGRCGGRGRERRAPVNEYRVDLSSPRLGADKLVDIYVAPVLTEPGSVVIVFQERSMADKIDRQLTHRAAAHSLSSSRLSS